MVVLPFKQASLVSELKTWCLSKLHSVDLRSPGEPDAGGKLRRSSSAAEGLSEEAAGVTVLPSGRGGSLQGPELHDGPAPLDSSRGESGSANHYFVVHVESSPGDLILPETGGTASLCQAFIKTMN